MGLVPIGVAFATIYQKLRVDVRTLLRPQFEDIMAEFHQPPFEWLRNILIIFSLNLRNGFINWLFVAFMLRTVEWQLFPRDQDR